MNQVDTEIQHVIITLENSHMLPSKTKRVPAQQVIWSDFSIPLPFAFHDMPERQEWAFIRDAINSAQILINNPTNSLPSENHWGVFSTALTGERHDSYLFYNHYMTCESSFADIPSAEASNPGKKTYSLESFRRQKISRDIWLPIQVVSEHFPKKTARN